MRPKPYQQHGTVSRPSVGRADPPPHGFPSLSPCAYGAPLGNKRLRRSNQRDRLCSCDCRLSSSGHAPDRTRASRSCLSRRDIWTIDWVIKGKCLRGLRPRSTTYTLYSLICQYRLCSLLVFPLGVLFAILRQSSPCLVCHHQQHFLPFALLML